MRSTKFRFSVPNPLENFWEEQRNNVARISSPTKSILICSIWTSVLLVLSGCDESFHVTKTEVEGTWVTKSSEGTDGTLNLNPNNTFTAEGMPEKVFYDTFSDKYGGPPDWSRRDSFQGKWHIENVPILIDLTLYSTLSPAHSPGGPAVLLRAHELPRALGCAAA